MILASLLASALMLPPAYVLMANPVEPIVAAPPQSSAIRPLPKAVKAEEKPCDLNVVDHDPAGVLQILSQQTGLNIILLSQPETKITTNLRGVRFIDILRHLCAVMNISYLKVGSTYVLASKERLEEAYPDEWKAANPPKTDPEKPAGSEGTSTEEEPIIITEFLQTNYVSAAQIAEVLDTLYGEKLTVIAGPVQVSPSVTSQDTASTTGASTNMLLKDPALDGGTSLAGKTLIFRGEQALVLEAVQLARRLDTIRPQVAIQVTVHDINDAALRDLGVTWSYGNVTIQERDTRGINFGSFDRSGLTFSAAIKALESQDKAKLMASPNISVLDGERAFVLVGDRINYPVLVGFGQGNVPIFSKQEERVGIYLQVAASVSSDDQITMSLYPQVSTITGFLEANGASYPQIATREAQTTIRVRSGETVVMGGLLKTEEVQQVQKVPILGDLPFLGELFRRRRTSQTTSQVIISITPTVLKGNESR